MTLDTNDHKAQNEMRKDALRKETKYQNSHKLISEYLDECLHPFTSPEHPDHHCPGCCKCECCSEHSNRYLKASNRYHDLSHGPRRQYKNNGSGWMDSVPTQEEMMRDLICAALGWKLYSMCMVGAGETPNAEGWLEWAERIHNDPRQLVVDPDRLERLDEYKSNSSDNPPIDMWHEARRNPSPEIITTATSYGCRLAAAYATSKCTSFRLRYLTNFGEFLNWLNPDPWA